MAKRKKFNPSPELLEWIKDLVVVFMNKHDGKSYWSNIHGHIFTQTGPAEWSAMTNYAKTKAINTVLDSMSEKRMIYRIKNFHPYTLLNPLDLIVDALDQEDDRQTTQSQD